MTLLNGLHHVAAVTTDIDSLVGFYRRVFDAEVTMDLSEDGMRHVFIRIGPDTVLHPFQIPGMQAPPPGQPMFQRGRLDHLALNASSEESFWALRSRLLSEGAADGEVVDMGTLWNMTFTDPDGGDHEVIWNIPGVPDDAGLARSEWTTVPPPEPAAG